VAGILALWLIPSKLFGWIVALPAMGLAVIFLFVFRGKYLVLRSASQDFKYLCFQTQSEIELLAGSITEKARLAREAGPASSGNSAVGPRPPPLPRGPPPPSR
jgi:hypothetical protein